MLSQWRSGETVSVRVRRHVIQHNIKRAMTCIIVYKIYCLRDSKQQISQGLQVDNKYTEGL